MTDQHTLGAFLRARRGQVSPEQAGLPREGHRRVPGLRREEVASLTGLSVDYYARLEQGRESHPSASVLRALARTLRLDPDAQLHLFAIAQTDTPLPPIASGAGGAVSGGLAELIGEWPHHPTVVLDECHTVVLANQLGHGLYAGHRHSDNLLRLIFLDSDAPEFYRDWPKVAGRSVAGLRVAVGRAPGNTELLALIGELTVHSPEFRRRWARADVREKTADELLLHHPLVGPLDLLFDTFHPAGHPNLLMKVFRAVSGSASAEGLAMLGSLTADNPPAPVAPVRATEVGTEPHTSGA